MKRRPAPSGWQQGVVYQIYPRSFADSNGDGIGDLPGITAKLDHLQALGVRWVWLSPVFASPGDDNGYDISDYRAIAPEYGTMADFDAMLAAMHARGIGLLMDLVVNHTSDEHPWFRQARTSRSNPYHDYYLWAERPNNWESFFSGPAWERNEATGEYFLHLFSRRQPDLNWDNPQVRQEVWSLMRFWLDKGVDGFRMDVINLISKRRAADGSLPDAPVVRPGFLQPGFEMAANGPHLLAYLAEMRREVLDHYDCITVGEMPGVTPDLARQVTDRETGTLDMVFQFDHVNVDSVPGGSKWDLQPPDLGELKRILARWQHALADGGWNSLYFNNHDQPRAVSRFGGDGPHRTAAAKMLATCLHGLQGTPYVYQGDEIGMTNYPLASIADCRDIESINFHREALAAGRPADAVMAAIRAKGRDNARTPMQWSAAPQAGFTTGTPWLPVHPGFAQVNAERERADAGSVFHHYRRLIALRRERAVLTDGCFELLLADHADVFAYRRTLGDDVLIVVCNFRGHAVQADVRELRLEGATLLLGNVEGGFTLAGGALTLAPFEALLLEGVRTA